MFCDRKMAIHLKEKINKMVTNIVVWIRVSSKEEKRVGYDDGDGDENAEVDLWSQQERSCKQQRCSNKFSKRKKKSLSSIAYYVDGIGLSTVFN